MKILVSSCLIGKRVMHLGGSSQSDFIQSLKENPEIEIVSFCPEDAIFNTPRNNMLIHNGDGQDIWSGHAHLFDTKGNDCSEGAKDGARKMLKLAQAHMPDLIILTEESSSCGTQAIFNSSSYKDGVYGLKPGIGITAALLINNGFLVMGHKNELEINEFLSMNLNSILRNKNLQNYKVDQNEV